MSIKPKINKYFQTFEGAPNAAKNLLSGEGYSSCVGWNTFTNCYDQTKDGKTSGAFVGVGKSYSIGKNTGGSGSVNQSFTNMKKSTKYKYNHSTGRVEYIGD